MMSDFLKIFFSIWSNTSLNCNTGFLCERNKILILSWPFRWLASSPHTTFLILKFFSYKIQDLGLMPEVYYMHFLLKCYTCLCKLLLFYFICSSVVHYYFVCTENLKEMFLTHTFFEGCYFFSPFVTMILSAASAKHSTNKPTQ